MKHSRELLNIVLNLPSKAQDIRYEGRQSQIYELYEHSFRITDGVLFYAVRFQWKDYLILSSDRVIPWEFDGVGRESPGQACLVCEETGWNCRLLIEIFPDLEPSPIGKRRSTFGVGDRLGTASVGHLSAFSCYPGFVPILAQQSLRELELTGRTYRDVIDAAVWGVFKTGYRGFWGADGDHLKNIESVQSALKQGCTMITADLSDYMRTDVDVLSDDQILCEYGKIDDSYRKQVEADYLPVSSLESSLPLNFTEKGLAKLVLIYKNAIDFAVTLYEAGREILRDFDFEISIDETTVATSIEAHYFIAKELQNRKIPFTGVAPRYVGEFQKGIDYMGDLEAFSDHFAQHAELASRMGHKISVHSSSDKFSAYPIIKQQKQGACHLKTSGTNWLVALQVIACADPDLFRRLFNKAYDVYETAKTYYHITPDWSIRSNMDSLSDVDMVSVFKNNTDRQVMHVSYGEMKKDSDLWNSLQSVLERNLPLYHLMLEQHIGRHLDLLS